MDSKIRQAHWRHFVGLLLNEIFTSISCSDALSGINFSPGYWPCTKFKSYFTCAEFHKDVTHLYWKHIS